MAIRCEVKMDGDRNLIRKIKFLSFFFVLLQIIIVISKDGVAICDVSPKKLRLPTESIWKKC